MPRLLLWSVIAGSVGCLNQPTLATITPDYAFQDSDGCVAVTLQGHHLGESATARIDDAEIIDLQPATNDPDRPEHAQDVGFLYTGLVPASSSGNPGWADVVMTVDGESGEDLTIEEGFYYRTCPPELSAYADDLFVPYTPGTIPTPTTTTYTTPYDYYSATPDYTVDPTINIEIFDGCGLDPTVTTVVFTDIATGTATDSALVAVCAPSSGSVDIPDGLVPGQYTVELVRDGGRQRLSPYRCGAPTTATYYSIYYATPDQFVCPFDIVIGGGP